MATVRIYFLSEKFNVLWGKEFHHNGVEPIPEGYTLDGMLQSAKFETYYREVMRTILMDNWLKYDLETLNPHIVCVCINNTFLTPDGFNNLCDTKDSVEDHLYFQGVIQMVLKAHTGIEFAIPPQETI